MPALMGKGVPYVVINKTSGRGFSNRGIDRIDKVCVPLGEDHTRVQRHPIVGNTQNVSGRVQVFGASHRRLWRRARHAPVTARLVRGEYVGGNTEPAC